MPKPIYNWLIVLIAIMVSGSAVANKCPSCSHPMVYMQPGGYVCTNLICHRYYIRPGFSLGFPSLALGGPPSQQEFSIETPGFKFSYKGSSVGVQGFVNPGQLLHSLQQSSPRQPQLEMAQPHYLPRPQGDFFRPSGLSVAHSDTPLPSGTPASPVAHPIPLPPPSGTATLSAAFSGMSLPSDTAVTPYTQDQPLAANTKRLFKSDVPDNIMEQLDVLIQTFSMKKTLSPSEDTVFIKGIVDAWRATKASSGNDENNLKALCERLKLEILWPERFAYERQFLDNPTDILINQVESGFDAVAIIFVNRDPLIIMHMQKYQETNAACLIGGSRDYFFHSNAYIATIRQFMLNLLLYANENEQEVDVLIFRKRNNSIEGSIKLQIEAPLT